MIIPFAVTIILLILNIVACVAAFVSILFLLYDREKDILIFAIICIILVAVFSLLIIPTARPCFNDNQDIIFGDLKETQPLYAIKDAQGINGIFLLGGGGINSNDYYIGYTSINENTHKRIKINASDALIITDDNETPRIEKYEGHDIKNTIIPNLQMEFRGYDAYKIYIPTDGLRSSYDLN